jgi:hypothetical protein
MTAFSAAARVLVISLLAGVAAPALAQEPPTGDSPPPVAPDPATVEGARTFTPADFTRFAPKNALDMLRQVPGFAIREASQERGLGQATGNVLINGQRISGKSNDVLTELSRVPSQNVTRIDIVDGATLSIPGLSGQVANVIVKSTQKISGQYTWEPEFRAYNTDPVLARGQVSVSGRRGPVDFTLGLQLQGGNSGADGRTFIYGPDFQFIERRYDQFTGEFIAPRASSRFTYDGPGSSVANLNLSYQRNYFDYLETGTRQGPGKVDRERLVTIRERGFEYEIGGDFEFAFGPGRLKLIGLNRFENAPFAQTVRTAFADGSVDVGSRFARIGDSKERIARAEYRWKTGKSDWQISTEAAFNSLDNVSQLFELRPNGNFEQIPLPGGSAEVTEDRYEVIGSFGRPLGADLSIQLSAGGEYSKLQQVGGGGLTRSFWRPKGSFSAAWKPTKSLDVNLKLARKVGQLNFFDFLATVNLGSDTENAGNPDLVPQQSWEGEVEAIRNFGAYGTSTFRVYGRLIDDIVDIIPIGLTGESPGNIDRATVYGAEWKTTFNFDPMGWKGAKLDARFQAQQTELEDPLTGEKRRISNSMIHLAELALRHDIPGSDFAYGASMSYQFNALNYRLTEVGRQSEGPVFANVFVEHKDVLGLNVRATIANVLGATSMWDRTVYTGRRTGPVSFFERRDRRIGPIFSFTVRGKF